MDQRFGLIFLLLVGASWNSDAIGITSCDSQVSCLKQGRNIGASDEASGDSKICKLCESYVTQVVDYLTEEKNQAEILGIFRQACSRLGPFKEECSNLVDNYVPQLFSEISSIEPDKICQSVHFCEQITTISSQIREDSCGFCHHTISQILVKLKDPDTQIEVLEMLLKACNSLKNYEKQCKKLVFEYGPIILINSQRFLESTDICTVIHACAPAAGNELASSSSSVGTQPLHADS